jgi:hypothetical protein
VPPASDWAALSWSATEAAVSCFARTAISDGGTTGRVQCTARNPAGVASGQVRAADVIPAPSRGWQIEPTEAAGPRKTVLAPGFPVPFGQVGPPEPREAAPGVRGALGCVKEGWARGGDLRASSKGRTGRFYRLGQVAQLTQAIFDSAQRISARRLTASNRVLGHPTRPESQSLAGPRAVGSEPQWGQLP